MAIPDPVKSIPVVSEMGAVYSVDSNSEGFDTRPKGKSIRIAIRVNHVVDHVVAAFRVQKKIIDTDEYPNHNLPNGDRGHIFTFTRQNPEQINFHVIDEQTSRRLVVEERVQIFATDKGAFLVEPMIQQVIRNTE